MSLLGGQVESMSLDSEVYVDSETCAFLESPRFQEVSPNVYHADLCRDTG